MQVLNTLQETHGYNVVHLRWDMSTHKLLVLYYYTIQQNEGIQPTTHLLHFLFTLSQSLSHNRIDRFTMLQYNTQSYYNAFLSQGNYQGKMLWVTQYHGPTNYWPTNIPKISFGGTAPDPLPRDCWHPQPPVGTSVQ